MKITKKTQYGLRALLWLGQSKKTFLSLREIAEGESIPFDYLEKVFSQLEKAGLVKSKKGIQGGYSLARSPKKIGLAEIMKALEKKMLLVECLDKKSLCPRKRSCRSAKAWVKIQNSLEKTINSITLNNLY